MFQSKTNQIADDIAGFCGTLCTVCIVGFLPDLELVLQLVGCYCYCFKLYLHYVVPDVGWL